MSSCISNNSDLYDFGWAFVQGKIEGDLRVCSGFSSFPLSLTEDLMIQGSYWSLARSQFGWWCWDVDGSDLTKGVIMNMGNQPCHTSLLWGGLLLLPTTLAGCVGTFVPSKCLLVIEMEDRATIGTCSNFQLSNAVGDWARLQTRCFCWIKQSLLDCRYSESSETAEVGLALHAVSLVSTNAMASVTGLVWIPSVLRASKRMSKSAIPFRSISRMTSSV